MASVQFRKGLKKPYRVRWRDFSTNKQRNKSFLRRKDANAFIETLRSADNLISRTDATATVRDALERWYTLCTTTGRGGREPVERSTAEAYNGHKKVIESMIGSVKLMHLDRKSCEDFRDALLAKYSRPYAKKFLSSFKSALVQAVSDNVIATNPASSVNILISSRQRKARRIKIPELHELKKLTDTIDLLMQSNDKKMHKAWSRFGPMFYTQMYSGMRPTEIRGLPWKDIDWERNGVNVTQDADPYCKIGVLKSGAAYRYIPLPNIVMEMLENWQKICPESQYDLVFPNWKGNVESHANITNRGWYVLCDKAGLTESSGDGKVRAKFKLNCLRHVKASLEISLGRTPKRIQQIMGHEDIKLTFDTYGHLFMDESFQDDPNDLCKLISTVA